MTFELRLLKPAVLPNAEPIAHEYDAELDTIGSVLSDICEVFENIGIGFAVRICTDTPWPVFPRPDLVIVLEQIGSILAALDGSQPCQLDFYEQVVEREVKLIPRNGHEIVIQCCDMIPHSGSQARAIVASTKEVIEELSSLAADFIATAMTCCASLTSHPWFVQWARDIQTHIHKPHTGNSSLA